MKSYGLLGALFITLFILGYVSQIILVIGIVLVAIDAYMSHSFYKEIAGIYKELLLISECLEYDEELDNHK
jgi:hypothetical protein